MMAFALELLAPLRCAACDERTPRLFCEACGPSVEAARDPTRAPFVYGGAVEVAVQRFKFGGRADLGPRLAVPLATAATALSTVHAVVSVPLHPKRLAERGYDQAALLARPVATRLAVPWLVGALRRVRDTPKQSLLAGAAERRHNVSGAFTSISAVKGLEILLVDDVVTTGTTFAACRDCLLAAGARRVFPFALAVRERAEESRIGL